MKGEDKSVETELKTNGRFDTAANALCGKIGDCLHALPPEVKNSAQEIRLRAGRPVSLCCTGGIYFLGMSGRLTRCPAEECLTATKEDLDGSFKNICGYSVYSHENEIRNGYITVYGGHRVGICGTAVFKDGNVCGMKDISSINVRVAREVIGCADAIMAELKSSLSGGLLLAGAPSSGKTTILRDIARQLSCGENGESKKVTVVDERGEIAGTYLGVPQNDLGPCCDVLDGYPKAGGIMQAIRALSPQFIVCDELGTQAEASAVEQSLNAGAAVVASIHAGSIEELLKRRQAAGLLRTGAFENIVMLGGKVPGTVSGIYKTGDLLAEDFRLADTYSVGDACGIYGIA